MRCWKMFRESHSLKGAARMLGLSRIETARMNWKHPEYGTQG